MTMCPQCQVRPSRLKLVYRGTTPLCEPCTMANRKANWARCNARRRAVRAVPEAPEVARRERRSLVEPDLPPHEIERLYQKALAEIRSRNRSAQS